MYFKTKKMYHTFHNISKQRQNCHPDITTRRSNHKDYTSINRYW